METKADFEWDENKDKTNQEKHGVSFALAQLAFLDHNRLILEDLEHNIDGVVKSFSGATSRDRHYFVAI